MSYGPEAAVVVSCDGLAVAAESCNELVVVAAESCNGQPVEEAVSTLCTAEVVVVLYKEVGEEGNRPVGVVESVLALVGEVEPSRDKLVAEVHAAAEVNVAAAVSNVVVVVNCSSKGQGVAEKNVAVVAAVNAVVVVVDGCSKPE